MLSAQVKTTDLHPLLDLGLSYENFIFKVQSYCNDPEIIHYSKEMAAPFNNQSQITCESLEVLGKKRKVEFLINEGYLGHIWIFISKEELEEAEITLKAEYGDVVKVINNYKIFASENIAIRLEPAEILIANKELLYEITSL